MLRLRRDSYVLVHLYVRCTLHYCVLYNCTNTYLYFVLPLHSYQWSCQVPRKGLTSLYGNESALILIYRRSPSDLSASNHRSATVLLVAGQDPQQLAPGGVSDTPGATNQIRPYSSTLPLYNLMHHSAVIIRF